MLLTPNQNSTVSGGAGGESNYGLQLPFNSVTCHWAISLVPHLLHIEHGSVSHCASTVGLKSFAAHATGHPAVHLCAKYMETNLMWTFCSITQTVFVCFTWWLNVYFLPLCSCMGAGLHGRTQQPGWWTHTHGHQLHLQVTGLHCCSSAQRMWGSMATLLREKASGRSCLRATVTQTHWWGGKKSLIWHSRI